MILRLVRGGITWHESALNPAEIRTFLFFSPALSGIGRYRQVVIFYGIVRGTD